MSGYRYLAANLRRCRLEAGWSQAELARRIGRRGFSQPYVSDLERGLWPSDPAHVSLLAAALNVPESAFERRVRGRIIAVAA